MERIEKMPPKTTHFEKSTPILEGTTVTVEGMKVTVQGPKGEIVRDFSHIDVDLKNIDKSTAYSWTWDENPDYLQHLIRAAAYDNHGNIASDEIVIFKFP